jgi:hypothetical protein
MAYVLSSESGSTTPICLLLSINPPSYYVCSLLCVHCLYHITLSTCLLIWPVNTPPLVIHHDSVLPSHALLTYPSSCLYPLIVCLAYLLLATLDHQWIDAFPFAAKSTYLSHPKTNGTGSSIAPVILANIRMQDITALYSTHHASPLDITPWGLDLVSF